MVKVVRIYTGFKIFDVKQMMDVIKEWNKKRLNKMIEQKPELANSQLEDNSKISLIIITKYSIRTVKLIIVLFSISYFVGVAWFIICDFYTDEHKDWDGDIHEDYFFFKFPVFWKTDHYHDCLIMIYFAFTTLSTIGFGDFHPRSDFERIVVALIFLFGVAIFSYVMGNFLEILGKYNEFNLEPEDFEKL